MTIIGKVFYRPAENHLGIIYRFGRFGRFVDPDRWTFLIPWIESVVREVSLDMRISQISLKELYTKDKVALDFDLTIFYLVDLRAVHPESYSQGFRYVTENVWNDILCAAVTDIARNVIVVAHPFEKLFTEEGRNYLRRGFSAALAQRVKGFGILLNPKIGVNVINLQPNDAFKQAIKEETIAKTIGLAAAERLQSIASQFKDHDQEQAVFTLVMEMASAVAKNGQLPDLIFPNSIEQLRNILMSGKEYIPYGADYERLQQNRRPKSIAGD